MPLMPGHDLLAKRRRGLGARRSRPQAVQQRPVRRRRRARQGGHRRRWRPSRIVYFRFRGRSLIFWLIFITLMLPLEVRIVPTYAVAANALAPIQAILDLTGITWLIAAGHGLSRSTLQWGLLNSYTGLILPLVATATGTFLYRQFFLTMPDELAEAAKMDGVGPAALLLGHVCCRCRAPTWSRSSPSCSSGPGTSISGRCWSPPTRASAPR